jgi:hypothetical protein
MYVLRFTCGYFGFEDLKRCHHHLHYSELFVLLLGIGGLLVSIHYTDTSESAMQDILVVGIGKYVLTVDISKVSKHAPPGGFSVDDPLLAPVNNPPEGVHVVGEHNSDVTDLSVPLWTPTCFASASQDGTVRFLQSWFLLVARPLIFLRRLFFARDSAVSPGHSLRPLCLSSLF